MTLSITIDPAQLADLLPPAREFAEAAAVAVLDKVKAHLVARNDATAPKRGFPKSNYWGKAARSAVVEPGSGATVTVAIPQEGVALHYYGGTVLPKKKALAIPIDPSVADIWPSEANALTDHIELMWPKNSEHGFLKDAETGELLWLLVPKATIPADRSVLPDDDALGAAAASGVWELLGKDAA